MGQLKISDTMGEALVYLGWGAYRAHLEPATRTLEALERRGMIRWSTDAELGRVGEYRVHDTTVLWTVTLDGWAWLKAEMDMDRPADQGRATVAEALELAYPHNAQVDLVDAWIESRTEADRERRDLFTPVQNAYRDLTAGYLGQALADADADDHGPESGALLTGPGSLPSFSEPVMAAAQENRASLSDPAELTDWERDLVDWASSRPPLREDELGRLTLEQAWDDVTVLAAPERGEGAVRMYSETEFLARLVHAARGRGRLAAPADDPSGLTRILLRLGLAMAVEEPRYWGRAVHYVLSPRGFHRAAIIRSVAESTPESREAERHAAAIAEANRLTHERDAAVIRTYGQVPAPLPHRVPGASLTAAEREAMDVLLARIGEPVQPDPREPFTVVTTSRDLHGTPVSYYGVPIPADLAADWTGFAAICWARGVHAARS